MNFQICAKELFFIDQSKPTSKALFFIDQWKICNRCNGSEVVDQSEDPFRRLRINWRCQNSTLVIGDTSYSLFFKGLLFRSLHCKTGKSFDTPLSQWASFVHEKQDVTEVLNSCWTCPIAWSYIEAKIHDYNWTEMFCERMLLLSAVLGILFVLQCPSTSGKRVKYFHSHTDDINFT